MAAIAALDLSCSPAPGPTAPPTVAIAPVGKDPSPVAVTAPDPAASGQKRRAGIAGIAWETAEREARERALRQGLPLIVYVRADWSATALEMERKAWSDPRVAEAARRFVALELDVSSAEGDAELYAQRYGIERIPSTLLFDASGRKAATLSGEASADALLEAMQKASE